MVGTSLVGFLPTVFAGGIENMNNLLRVIETIQTDQDQTVSLFGDGSIYVVLASEEPKGVSMTVNIPKETVKAIIELFQKCKREESET